MKSFFGHHGFDSFDEGADLDIERRDPQCNRCRSTDVRWRQQNGQWRLFSLMPGVEHQCERPINADAFGAVSE